MSRRLSERSLRAAAAGVAGVSVLLVASAAWATNGMDAIAQSSRAAGMGGADQAVATDPSAMNTNPAGITHAEFQAGGSLNLLMPSLTMSDQVTTPAGVMPLNTDVSAEPSTFPLMGLGFTAAASESVFLGMGFYVQGGMGATFEDLGTMVDDNPMEDLTTNPTPATYRTSSQVAFMKLTPTLAYRLELDGDAISFGAAVNVGMAQMQFNHSGFQFPEMDADHVYVAHEVDFESDTANTFGGRFGVLAELFDGLLAIGASYQTPTRFTLGGTTVIDGGLEYTDVAMDFGWPAEWGAGVSVRPLEGLLLAFDARVIQWSDTMDTVTLENSADPRTVRVGFAEFNMPFQMNWEDQLVMAFGAEYQAIDLLAIRAGLNHAPSPVGPDGINPLFPAVTELHGTLGLGLTPAERWQVDAALEIVPEVGVTSDANNQLAFEPSMDPTVMSPNGYQNEVAMSQTAFHLGVTYGF